MPRARHFLALVCALQLALQVAFACEQYPYRYAAGVTCTGDDFPIPGDTCTQHCPSGQAATPVVTVATCGDDGLWDNIQVGTEDNCVGPAGCNGEGHGKPWVEHGYWHCYGGQHFAGSTCELVCDPFYNHVKVTVYGTTIIDQTDTRTFCAPVDDTNTSAGYAWTNAHELPTFQCEEAPGCYTPIIDNPNNPDNGHNQWTCTDANNPDSDCTLSCPEGYHTIGANVTTCEVNDLAPSGYAWSRTPGSCDTTAMCAGPYFDSVDFASCTYSNGSRAWPVANPWGFSDNYYPSTTCTLECTINAYYDDVLSEDDDYTPTKQVPDVSSITCGLDGKWSTDLNKIACSVPPPPCTWALGGPESAEHAQDGYGDFSFGFIFGSCIAVVGAGVIFEFAFHFAHHYAEHHRKRRMTALLEAVRHELSVVGLLAFGVYMVASSCSFQTEEMAESKEVLELIHMLLFLIIVVYFALLIISMLPFRFIVGWFNRLELARKGEKVSPRTAILRGIGAPFAALLISASRIPVKSYVPLRLLLIHRHGLPDDFNLGRYLKLISYHKIAEAMEKSWQGFGAILFIALPLHSGVEAIIPVMTGFFVAVAVMHRLARCCVRDAALGESRDLWCAPSMVCCVVSGVLC